MDPANRMMLRQAIGMVAEELGISFAEAKQMPSEEFYAVIQRMQDRAIAEARLAASELIKMQRITAVMEAHDVPKGMTVGDALAAGIIQEEAIRKALDVTEAEIDEAPKQHEGTRG